MRTGSAVFPLSASFFLFYPAAVSVHRLLLVVFEVIPTPSLDFQVALNLGETALLRERVDCELN